MVDDFKDPLSELEEETKPKDEQPKKEETVTHKPSIDTEILKLRNQFGYVSRTLSTINEQLAEMKAERQHKQEQSAQPVDEIDKVAESDWKKGVSMLIQKELEKSKEKDQLQMLQVRNSEILERNKKEVLLTHPEIDDDNSLKSQIFRDIVLKNPDWLSNPYGPKLAMFEMERQLNKKHAQDEDLPNDKVSNAVEKEKQRVVRAMNANLPPSNTNPPKDETVNLTPDQKIFCQRQGIDLKEYAKTLKKLQGEKEVSI